MNVAQFVSFDSELRQRFARVFGHPANHQFASPGIAFEALFRVAPEGTVNIRTFKPGSQSSEFLQGLNRIEDVEQHVRRLAKAGYYIIVNETVGMQGGVGGVHLGGVIEFSPEDTPRSVDKAGSASLPASMAVRLLQTVYRFKPELDFEPNERVEFTLHPKRRGWLHQHTIIWEHSEINAMEVIPDIRWPNLFSRFLGDKLFGLLIADMLGFPVPFTTAVSRSLAPFSFGESTGTAEVWTRTCPRDSRPGRFQTVYGWTDPFHLLLTEDPDGTMIASVLSQDAVDAQYSGGLISQEGTEPVIEGVRGRGNEFMLGLVPPEEIPLHVKESVYVLYTRVEQKLGPVKLEWAYDGVKTWIIQIMLAALSSTNQVIVPGSAGSFTRFNVEQGLESLRKLVETVKGEDFGIILIGDIGVTSHMGDVLRQAQVPSRIERN